MRHNRSARITALLVGTTVITSCGTAPEGTEDVELAEGDVTLSMTWWGGDQRTQATLQALELFEQENPTITVDPQYADWSGYWDRLATTTAANDAPDVMQFDEVYLASYAGRNALADLDDLSEFVDTSVMDEAVLDSGRVGDTLVGMPIGAAPNGVIINTTLFDRLGVPVPDTDSWTWEEFDQAAEAITEASGGDVHGVELFGSDTFSLNIWARQNGDELFDENGDVAIEPETVASYFDLERGWIESGASRSAAEWAEGAGNPLDQSAIVTGEVAMMFIAAGSMPSYQAAAPDFEYQIGNWPTDEDTAEGFQYLKPSMYWSVSSRSEHPAEAGLLLDFLTTDERVAELFAIERGVPANPAFLDALSGSLDPAGEQVVDFSEQMGEESGQAPAVTPNGASNVQVVIGRFNQEALLGDLSSQEAAEGFIEDIQGAVDSAAS